MIFISYSRTDKDKIGDVISDMEALGHTVWVDNKLSGGQKWWEQILQNIRDTEIFIFILSKQALDSPACKLEYQYAAKLNKPILPILIDKSITAEVLPPILSEIQLVDYNEKNTTSALKLARSISEIKLLNRELPEPLPDLPKMPVSYLGTVIEKIESNITLSYEEQSSLVFDINRYFFDNPNTSEIKDVINKFKNRKDLLAVISVELDKIVKNEVSVDTYSSYLKENINKLIGYSEKKSKEKNINTSSVLSFFGKTLIYGIVGGVAGFIVFLSVLYFAGTDYSSRFSSIKDITSFHAVIRDPDFFFFIFIFGFTPWFLIGIVSRLKIVHLLILITISIALSIISFFIFMIVGGGIYSLPVYENVYGLLYSYSYISSSVLILVCFNLYFRATLRLKKY